MGCGGRTHDGRDAQREYEDDRYIKAPITPARLILTEIELDALTELVNIGVSRAVNSLRELVGEQVLLSVPALRIMDRALAASFIEASEGAHLIAVRQVFEGEFSGSALLISPSATAWSWCGR